jgi:putative ABC transport system ATP-binding protein
MDVSTLPSLVSLRAVNLTLPAASGPVHILQNLDLDITSGDSVGLVGPSGSGETSLLMVLAGLERATSGQVHVDGRDLVALDEDGLARFRRDCLGIVFQNFHLIPTMTALENVALPLEFSGIRDAADRAEASLRAVGLGHRLTHLPGMLSGGEQQRVAVARAFVAEPRLLLADEPTGNLDTQMARGVLDLLEELHRDGATIVMVTHDPELAIRAQREVHIVDGQVVDLAVQPRVVAAAQASA